MDNSHILPPKSILNQPCLSHPKIRERYVPVWSPVEKEKGTGAALLDLSAEVERYSPPLTTCTSRQPDPFSVLLLPPFEELEAVGSEDRR